MQHSKLACLALFCALPASAQGLLVTRADGNLQFAPVYSLAVNGKEKIHLLGAKPELSGPVDKLPGAKLGATLINDARSGVPMQYQKGGGSAYVYPDGIPKKTAPAPPQAWKESSISYKKAKQDKVPVPVPAGQFLAFLSNGVQELSDICMDPGALALIGGKSGAFGAQLELTAAAVNAFGTQPEMAPVERKTLDFMLARQHRFDDGADSVKSLTEGLRFAELSAKAYPNQTEHRQIRKQLADSKLWIDKRAAVLQALYTGSQWDAFLVSYREFEKHEGSFPELAAKRTEALRNSLDSHWKNGKERMARSEYRRAFNELKFAGQRKPSDSLLRNDVSIAWGQYSREVAVDRQNKRKQLSAGEQDVLEQDRAWAQRYKQQNKLDEALAKIAEAEKTDAESLPVLLTKAEILGARKEVVKALATLDQYDQLAIDKERDAGNKLRTELLFEKTDGIDTARKKLADHWAAGRYHQTLDLANQSLRLDDRAPVILYYAGVASMATRHRKEGAALLTKFLETSDNLDSDGLLRASVARILTGGLPASPNTPAPGDGETSWFSGRKLPAGIFYDPLSGTFVPKIDHITASNKMYVKFAWDGDRLKSIMPSFEKVQQTTNEKPFYFTYSDGVPHVVAVDAGETPRKIPKDPDALLKESNVLLPNNPLVDAPVIQKLTGKGVTLGVAGNRFFHPFVWERPYYFALTYDDQGRLQFARQLPEAKETIIRAAGLVEVEFEWNGLKLASVTAYSLDDKGVRGGEVYSRTMNYVQDKLMGEDIHSGQRDTKIKYVWNGATLVSADCGKDEALDNRSRDVVFAGGSGTRGRGK